MGFYLETEEKKDCFQCTACATVCPVGAITMQENTKDGYWYPVLDESKCIHCGKCRKACINLTRDSLSSPVQKAYVLKNKKEEERRKSASGGISGLLMRYVIEHDGVVYGASYNEKNEVVHSRATTLAECEKFRTSKYVKSKLIGIYEVLLADLKEGKMVLFTGTPCQVAGLKSIVSPKYQKQLLLCEIMCESVASPRLYEKYLKQLERNYKELVKSVNFRSKELGAHNMSMAVTFESGKRVLLPIKEDNLYADYMQLFGTGISAPEACLHCKFEAMKERSSDFTIGDYWGRKEILKDDNLGLSMLLVNTEKASIIFKDYLKDKVDYEEVPIETAFDNNHVGHLGTVLNRKEFFQDLPSSTFEELAKKYVHKHRFRTKVGILLPAGVKEWLKKVLLLIKKD